MGERVLSIENATIGYSCRKKPVAVAANINASLCSGELVALIGRNGSGKSTLLRTISAQQKPLAGNVLLENRPVTELSAGEAAKLISVVLSNANVAPLSVQELVSLGRVPHTNFLGHMTAGDKAAVEEAMRQMGVTALAERMLQTISDGERQKCMIAKALAQDTPLILLDEPTAFLDYPSKVALFRLLKELAAQKGKAIILSTHDIELAFALAGKIWLVDGGCLHEGTPAELAGNGALQSFIDCDTLHYNTILHRIEII